MTIKRITYTILGTLILLGGLGLILWGCSKSKSASQPAATNATNAPTVAAPAILPAASAAVPGATIVANTLVTTQLIYTVQVPPVPYTNSVVGVPAGLVVTGNNNNVIVGNNNCQYNGGQPDRSKLVVAAWASTPAQVVKIPTAGCYHQQIPSGAVIEIQVSYGTRVGLSNCDDAVIEVAVKFAGDPAAYVMSSGHWSNLGEIRSYVVRSKGAPSTVTINVSPADFSR